MELGSKGSRPRLSLSKETIKSFLQENDLIGSLRSCVLNEPSTFSLVCVEDSVLIEIEFSRLKKLTETDHSVAQNVLSLLLGLAIKKEQREYEFLCLSAEERLNTLLERAPDVCNRVRQQDLARYLGITPVALSRIRARK